MLKDLKELERFFKICRKQGVADISFDGVSVKFGELPSKASNQSEEVDEIPSDDLTPEELLYYAVNGGAQS